MIWDNSFNNQLTISLCLKHLCELKYAYVLAIRFFVGELSTQKISLWDLLLFEVYTVDVSEDWAGLGVFNPFHYEQYIIYYILLTFVTHAVGKDCNINAWAYNAEVT